MEQTQNNNTTERRKRVFSAIKPTGNPTLGNYLGAMRYWGGMADEQDCLYAVADLHAITVAIEPKELRENSKRLFALLIAVGIDPQSALCLCSRTCARMRSLRGCSITTPCSAKRGA